MDGLVCILCIVVAGLVFDRIRLEGRLAEIDFLYRRRKSKGTTLVVTNVRLEEDKLIVEKEVQL